MNCINEQQLKDYERNGFVGTAKIKGKGGLFTLIITVKGRPTDEITICTQRKTPREWQSLDRMINHYRLIMPSLTHYHLYFSESIP